jgi:DnaJ like chaperone protein
MITVAIGLRNDFSRGVRLYWGKIIGTLAGAATLKPWFVLLGLLLGHQFDRGFAARMRDFDSRGRTDARLPEEFVRPLFQAMGHLAKSDGRVTEDEIRAARSIMHRLGLGPAKIRNAMQWFDEGKRSNFPLQSNMQQTRRLAARNPELRLLFMRLLMEVVLSKDRVSQHERALLWTICKEFDIGRVELAQMEAMLRAQKGFRHSPAGDADASRVRMAYATLGVDSTASNAEVTKAYRRLMSRNHPDKIAASNPDRQALAQAEQRTKDIRRAYEMLKARRSIR